MAVRGMPQPPKPLIVKEPKRQMGGVLQHFSSARTGYQGAISTNQHQQAAYVATLEAFRMCAVGRIGNRGITYSSIHPELELAVDIRHNNRIFAGSFAGNSYYEKTSKIARKNGLSGVKFVPGTYSEPTDLITDLVGTGYLDEDRALTLLQEIEDEGGKAGEKTKAFLSECEASGWISQKEHALMVKFTRQIHEPDSDAFRRDQIFQTIKEKSELDSSAIIDLMKARRELSQGTHAEREIEREAERQAAQTEQAEGQTRAQSR